MDDSPGKLNFDAVKQDSRDDDFEYVSVDLNALPKSKEAQKYQDAVNERISYRAQENGDLRDSNVRDYIAEARAGHLYDRLVAECQKIEPDIDRKEVKASMMRILFGRVDKTLRSSDRYVLVLLVFVRLYPTVFDWLKSWGNKLHRVLTQQEVAVMSEVVVKLDSDDRFVLPVHDAWYVKGSEKHAVAAKISGIIEKKVGINCTLDIK